MTEHDVSRRKVLAIVTNYGVEQDELVVPVDHLRGWGAQVDVAAMTKGPVETLVGDRKPGRTLDPDLTLDDVDPAAYDLLLVPGGTLNADTLRTQSSADRIVRAFTGSGRPVAAICHGPWVLVEAGAVAGKRLTSYASIADRHPQRGRRLDRSAGRHGRFGRLDAHHLKEPRRSGAVHPGDRRGARRPRSLRHLTAGPTPRGPAIAPIRELCGIGNGPDPDGRGNARPQPLTVGHRHCQLPGMLHRLLRS